MSVGLLAVAAVLTCRNTVHAGPWRFTITPGIGHDRFAETFYIEDTLALTPDSLEQIRKTEEALRESYASVGLGLDKDRWRFATTTYTTNAAWRNVSFGEGRVQSGNLRTDLRARFEWKGTDSDDTLSSAYTFLRLDVKPRLSLGGHWSAFVQADWEQADYNRTSVYTTDYQRARGQGGFQYLGDRLETFEIRSGITHRTVPDSARLQYTEQLVYASANGWPVGPFRTDADVSFAERVTDAGSTANDYRRWWTSVRADLSTSASWRLTGIAEWQHWKYDEQDDVNFDLTSVRLWSAARAILSDFWELGVQTEWRLERPSDASAFANGHDQWSIGPVVYWNPGPALWIELTPRIGRRNYEEESLIYDDYQLREINLSADFYLLKGPAAAATFTYLRESHDDPARNVDQLYLSLSLRFPLEP